MTCAPARTPDVSLDSSLNKDLAQTANSVLAALGNLSGSAVQKIRRSPVVLPSSAETKARAVRFRQPAIANGNPIAIRGVTQAREEAKENGVSVAAHIKALPQAAENLK
ncbi:MAG: hypothetical protein HYY23_12275 [Verrucomicrobia bacterium]|nr:hypothetical protein [Verrucomicrobiota bacterium]